MPSITIRVRASEVETLAQLFQFERDFFPGERLTEYQDGSYVMELDQQRSQFVVEQFGIAPDIAGFEPFSVWKNHERNQYPLLFGTGVGPDGTTITRHESSASMPKVANGTD